MKAETFVQLLTPVFLAQIPVRHRVLFRLHYTQVVYTGTRDGAARNDVQCHLITETAVRQKTIPEGLCCLPQFTPTTHQATDIYELYGLPVSQKAPFL